VEAYHIRGGPMICGSKLGYLEATLAYGLAQTCNWATIFQAIAGALSALRSFRCHMDVYGERFATG